MKISFDLDDTLILLDRDGPKDESIMSRLTVGGKAEFFRHGTRELFRMLRANGWENVIYTAPAAAPTSSWNGSVTVGFPFRKLSVR